MKIGILTFHAAYNYGSMLQAYALQSVIKQMGHDVEVLDFRPTPQKHMYRTPFSVFRVRSFLSDIKRCLLSGGKEFRKFGAKKLFENFLYSEITLSKRFSSLKQLSDESSKYDIIILGSDQIWNQNAVDHSKAYFGVGLNPKCRLVAYAPSMGPHPEKQNKTELKKYLDNIAFISVREKSTAQVLEQISGRKNIIATLDPTLLIPFKEYEHLILDYNNKGRNVYNKGTSRYIYYYTPGKHPELTGIARHIAESLQLPIKFDTGYFMEKDNNIPLPMGPVEFLQEIKNTELVIGTSFHLIVFCILLHKNFLCINGERDARMRELLFNLNLSDRIITAKNLSEVNIIQSKQIDWKDVDNRLTKLRTNSLEYINLALKP